MSTLDTHPTPRKRRARNVILTVSRADFLALWGDDSLTTADLERKTGATWPALRARAKVYGLPARRPGPKPRIDEAEVARIASAAAGRHEVAEVAATLGVHPATAYRAMRRLGVERRPYRHVADSLPIETLREAWAAGVSTDAMAAALGIPRSSIQRRARALGLPPRTPGFRSTMSFAAFLASRDARQNAGQLADAGA